MKKSKVETAETRRRIIETAAEQFRRDGIHATGLADVMTAVGLTHGGFYRHFKSKDELVAAACRAASEPLVEAVEAAAIDNRGKASKAMADYYLAPSHRDDPGGGCLFAALGSELVRADAETRAAASEGFTKLVEVIAEQLPRKKPKEATSDAIFMLSAMVGAMTMSRMVDDPKLSDAILHSVKGHLSEI